MKLYQKHLIQIPIFTGLISSILSLWEKTSIHLLLQKNAIYENKLVQDVFENCCLINKFLKSFLIFKTFKIKKNFTKF